MSKTDKYLYPAILTYEEGHNIAITFPDLPGCCHCASTDKTALKNAKEAMGLHLWGMEQDGDEIPVATPLKDVELEDNERSILVEVYMSQIRKRVKSVVPLLGEANCTK